MQIGQVTIVAPLNVPSLLGEHASELYAKNQFNLLELFLKDQAIRLDWDDEVISKTALTHAGVPVLRWEPAVMGLLLHRIARARERRHR